MPTGPMSASPGGGHGQSLKPFTKEAPGEPISSAIVKYNYQAQQLDELSLVKGARILILEKSGDGWWRGQYGNKVGWFPSNYTQEEIEDAHTYCMAENVLDIMVALYTFKVNFFVKRLNLGGEFCDLARKIALAFKNFKKLKMHIRIAWLKTCSISWWYFILLS